MWLVLLALFRKCSSDSFSTFLGLNSAKIENRGDGGLARAALINNPAGIIEDQSGNYYLMEENHIRKISPSGIISTVAGGGLSTADNIAATRALISSGYGIAIDKDGAIYYSEPNPACVIRVIKSFNVTTLIGTRGSCINNGDGPFPSRTLADVRGLFINKDSSAIYIAGGSECTVKKGEFFTAYLNAIAGTGTCANGALNSQSPLLVGLQFPYNVWVNDVNDVFFSEYGSCRVRKIANTGGISTVAGGSWCSYLVITTAASVGATSALYNVEAITGDRSGNIYFSDRSAFYVLRLSTATQTLHLVAGGLGNIMVATGIQPSDIHLGRCRGLLYSSNDELISRTRIIPPYGRSTPP